MVPVMQEPNPGSVVQEPNPDSVAQWFPPIPPLHSLCTGPQADIQKVENVKAATISILQPWWQLQTVR